MTSKQQLIEWLDQARGNLMTAIEGLSEEQMERREINGWSVKDHLVHLMVWDEMRFYETSRIARGGAPSMHPVDEEGVRWINEGFADARRHLPLSQVLADMQFAHEMVKQAVAAAPEDRLDEKLYGEIGAIGAGHEAGHAGIIRTWREKAGL